MGGYELFSKSTATATGFLIPTTVGLSSLNLFAVHYGPFLHKTYMKTIVVHMLMSWELSSFSANTNGVFFFCFFFCIFFFILFSNPM